MKLKNIGLGLLTIVILIAGAWSIQKEVQLVNLKAKKDKYLLVLLQSIPGQGLFDFDKILITDPTHKPDGAICFIGLKDKEKGCIKTDNYFLKKVSE